MNINEPEFYTRLIRALYDKLLIYPNYVQIEPEVTGERILFRVQGHATDQGLMIGAGGQNIKALQKLVGTVGMRAGLMIHVKVLEPYTGVKEIRNRPPFDPTWVAEGKDKPIAELLTMVCTALYGGEVSVATEHEVDNGEPTTKFTVSFAQMPTMEIQDAISTIFHAMCRGKGRNVVVKARAAEAKPAGRSRRAPARKVLGS
jgi:predicted RNA-binding protein YlqC (UPF0109 family)